MTSGSGQRRAAMFVRNFLRPSMTFIHDEIRFHERWSVEVFADRAMHLDRFGGATVHHVRPCSAGEYARYKLTRRIPSFDDIFEKRRFSVLHAHFGPMGHYALAYKRRYEIPMVITFHGIDVPVLRSAKRFWPTRWRYWLGWRQLVREADLFLAASTELHGMLIELGADPGRTRVHRLGVDLSKFTSVRPPDASSIKVLMVGRLVVKKGFDDAIRAVAMASDKVVATIIGEGPEREMLGLLAKELGVESRIHFAGLKTHDEVVQAMNDHHVVMAPSVVGPGGDRESGLIVLKEAGACARPSIGTLHGGIPEIIEDGETGFLVDEHDPRALAERLDRLVSDDDMRERMGRAAREKMEREYDQQVRVDALEDVYDELAGLGD